MDVSISLKLPVEDVSSSGEVFVTFFAGKDESNVWVRVKMWFGLPGTITDQSKLSLSLVKSSH